MTAERVAELVNAVAIAADDLCEIGDAHSKNRSDNLPDIVELVRVLAVASRNLSQTAIVLIARGKAQEQDAAIARMRSEVAPPPQTK
jgi:hypothetical protein